MLRLNSMRGEPLKNAITEKPLICELKIIASYLFWPQSVDSIFYLYTNDNKYKII